MHHRLLLGAVGALLLSVVLVAPARAETSLGPTSVPDRVVLNPTTSPTTSQSITWRTSPRAKDGEVEVREVGETQTRRVRAASTSRARLWGLEPAIHHTATLTRLRPATEYTYRVGNDAHGWSAWQRFHTAGAGEDPWEFLYFGDAQNGLDTVWPQVASAARTAHPDARASIFAGDLINNADEDAEWSQWFAALGKAAGGQQVIATPGNHELTGDLLLQQYRAHFEFASNGPALRGEDVWYTDYQGVRFVSLNGNAPLGGVDQAIWLDRILRDNPNRWTVVTFHQPMFSFRAGRDNIATRTLWLPVLERHGVDLVLQGHDHGYARGHLTRNEQADGVSGPAYVVSVAGSKYYEMAPEGDNNWTRNGARRARALEQVSTYQSVRVEGDRLVYRAVAAATGDEPTAGARVGDVIDAFTITKDASGRSLLRDDPTDLVD